MRKSQCLMSREIPSSLEEVIRILLSNRKLDPSTIDEELKDMEKYLEILNLDMAAKLTSEHIFRQSHIVLAADYDADGITSAAQMALFFRQIGYSNWSVVIPNRHEGYGFPLRAATTHPNAALFIVMDCGTHDVQAISHARSMGAEIIILDHHQVNPLNLAPATLLVNPKQPECSSSFKEFSASGLTLLYISRLRKLLSRSFGVIPLDGRYLAISSIGTVADLAPLTHANRLLAKAGLSFINKGLYPPLEELKRVSGVEGRNLTVGNIGFQLAPRINAAGRMGDPMLAFDLLTCEDTEESRNIAYRLHLMNAARQQEEGQVLRAVRDRVEAGEVIGKRALIMADPSWPHSVVGICAAKAQEFVHYGPVVLFQSDLASGTARGSARSVPGFDIFDALNMCSDLLIKWGGHRMAAGLTIAIANLEAFIDRFEAASLECDPDVFVPALKIDMELPKHLVTDNLHRALERLQPYGNGNPTPIFLIKGAALAVKKLFGRNRNHVALDVGGIRAVYWGASEKLTVAQGDTLYADLAVEVDWDEYFDSMRLSVKEIWTLG